MKKRSPKKSQPEQVLNSEQKDQDMHVSPAIANTVVGSSTVKLTEDVLRQLGFRGEGKDITNKPAYRFKVPKNEKLNRYYHYQIQIVLGDYPETNGNSGVLSLYDPEIKDAHCLTWEKDNGKKKVIKLTI